ncbi:MAG: type II toxin-antitoxin system VapC family toxin [Acidobacteria bacterium]|nr:type II toxin-antitoxin system VapC family toxin [Acidobacteriota bacterium]MBV9184974.1 type II toxin-antitoxin system VapC family toxin [Acidobacteriota bacterium]
MIVFIDANIPMIRRGREHAHREPSLQFLEAAQQGEIEACTSTEVLQEILYRYWALRRIDVAREVYDLFVSICPIVFEITLSDTNRAVDLMERHELSARDAIHAAVMLNRGIELIATFDADFERVPGIRRVTLQS